VWCGRETGVIAEELMSKGIEKYAVDLGSGRDFPVRVQVPPPADFFKFEFIPVIILTTLPHHIKFK